MILLAAALTATPVMPGAAVPVRTLQGVIGTSVYGPGRVANTPGGRLYVVDANAKLLLLSERGVLMGTVLSNASTVAVGAGKVFVGTTTAELVVLDATYGRLLSRVSLGLGDGPVGMSYDSVRNVVWMVFRTGEVEARRADGSVVSHFTSDVTGQLGTPVDIAVDAAGGIVWVIRERATPGGMLFGLSAADGTRLKVIGVDGLGPAEVPGALGLSSPEEIIVADNFSGKVVVVDSAGVTLQTVVVGPLGASWPAGLAFLRNGDLVVSDLYVGKLFRFGDGSPLPVCQGDADCDGMSDAFETANGLSSATPRDALLDKDGDGLLNGEEAALGTSPILVDTDGDGYSDSVEVATGKNPLDPNDHNPTPPTLVASGASLGAPGRVTLSATVGGVADSSGCTVLWQQTSGPAVVLDGATSLQRGFVARKAGSYGFSARASCGALQSNVANVAVAVPNLPPLADAPRTVVVHAGERLQLDARRTSDANGDLLAFAWEQVEGPAAVAGSATRTLAARIAAEGGYRFRASAVDPAGAVGQAVTDVVVVGSRPVAAAAVVSPVVGAVGDRIALDASNSYGGAGAAFAWRQVFGPAAVILDGALPVAGFVPAVADTYGFEVIVTQDGVSSPPALVEVYVSGAAATLPVAAATAPAVASVGSEVALDGSASTGAGALEYSWRQVSGPAAGLGSTDQSLAKAFIFAPGAYEFELAVRDAAGISLPVRVRVEARAGGVPIPVAVASAPASRLVGQVVVLDGSGSVDATRYRWTQLAGPWVVLKGAPVESFIPTEAGTYVFELDVENALVRSAPVRVSVVVGDGMGN
jgi:hypothetical protein